MEQFRSEVQYTNSAGEPVHSDLPGFFSERALFHACLDEWLNKSNGTGFFYVGNPYDLKDEFAED